MNVAHHLLLDIELLSSRKPLFNYYRKDETECVTQLLNSLDFTSETENRITALAEKLVHQVREHEKEHTGIEAFMRHYDLSTEEGILLMCLAEALLRIPDKETEQLLINDKLTSAQWVHHIGMSESSFVNMATRGLVLSGKLLKQNQEAGFFKSIWQGLLRKTSEPVIRKAVREAIKVLSEQFVIGQTMPEALKRSKPMMNKGYRYSYDMLGEVARTQKDADRYFQAYYDAISELKSAGPYPDLMAAPSISVKLSALHPRYQFTQRKKVVPLLIKRVKTLVLHAKSANISLTIDAEEADRLDVSLDIIEALFLDADFWDWEGIGLAVQAYQKRAFYLLDWLENLGREGKKRIQVRLVKGAYWDTEIKLSQVEGFKNYPVFTRKINTDVSYLACAKKMLRARDAIYPQFATHNAYSVAAILTMMNGKYEDYEFEFQNLQGMGKALHDQIVSNKLMNLPCRIYAPVGNHEDLLPYLVRRLLENGANSSFVNRIHDPKVPIMDLIRSPVQKVQSLESVQNPKIPLPVNLYGEKRKNSQGLDLSDVYEVQSLADEFVEAENREWHAKLPVFLEDCERETKSVVNPANREQIIGQVTKAVGNDVQSAVQAAHEAFLQWDRKPVQERAHCLRQAADLFETHRGELMYLLVCEAGKTLQDAIAEVREAVDFCRYYANLAEQTLVSQRLPGPTGEFNELYKQGRGVMLCISPWNFPMAIFTGQVVAALVAGNAVIAKPADQTPLIAACVVELLHEAGISDRVVQCFPGRGSVVGDQLVNHPLIAGVLFTGSNETATMIQKNLANRSGPILPFVAETGGINAMIADSSALPEQLVRDVVTSAFGSAGQRCSALRILLVQDDIADSVIAMLAGAMQELVVGDPMQLSTDVGPVIDATSQSMLNDYAKNIEKTAKLIYRVTLSVECQLGTFVAPQAFEVSSVLDVKREVFGPILHVVRYARKNLDVVIHEINQLGYGLTFGIQSRIQEQVNYIQQRIQAGNIYVNRNMIGAVVGVQPFGGNRLSGTGPKAGGPDYLTRLSREVTLTIDTTAAGGNASLMAMED